MDAQNQKYDEILQWLRHREGCSSARALARLALSLWNGSGYVYSLGSCLYPLDQTRLAWAKFIVDDYFANGERSQPFMKFCRIMCDEMLYDDPPVTDDDDDD